MTAQHRLLKAGKRREVRCFLRTKDPLRARRIAAWANARLEEGYTMTDRGELWNSISSDIRTFTIPGVVTVDGPKQERHCDAFQDRHIVSMFDPRSHLAFNRDADYFWAPLIALDLGTRLEEIALLQLKDVERPRAFQLRYSQIDSESSPRARQTGEKSHRPARLRLHRVDLQAHRSFQAAANRKRLHVPLSVSIGE